MKINSITNYPQNKQKKPSFEAIATCTGTINLVDRHLIRVAALAKIQRVVTFDAKVIDGSIVTTLDFLSASKKSVEAFLSNNFKKLNITSVTE